MRWLEEQIVALRERCAALPDRRTGQNGRYAMGDTGMAAFSVFFRQSPSFLAHQQALAAGPGRGRSNAHTLFGLSAIPSDNPIRAMLDGVPTEHVDGLFAGIVRSIDERGGLEAMRVQGDQHPPTQAAHRLHTGCDLLESAWQKARARFRARIRMVTHLATLTTYLVFPSWSALMRTLTTGIPPPQPP